MVPSFLGKAIAAEALQTTLDVAIKKRLADAALDAATAGRRQLLRRAHRPLPAPVRDHARGQGRRTSSTPNPPASASACIANGAWGFAATNDLTTDGVAKAARQAVGDRQGQREACRPRRCSWRRRKGVGEVSWKTPIVKNAMEVPIKDKVDLLLGVNAAAMKAGADFVNSMLFLVNEQKYFASHRRLLHRPGRAPHLGADDGHRDRQGQRQVPHARRPVRADGHGLRIPRRRSRGQGRLAQRRGQLRPVLRHEGRRDRRGQAGAGEAQGAVGEAGQVRPGARSLAHLCSPSTNRSAIRLELDRVLGYEANYAGTSFATLDKRQATSSSTAATRSTIFADKTQPAALGAVGYDDEGVKTKRWDLIKDGMLVNYQAIRDQAHILGKKESRRLLLRRLVVERAVPAHGQRLAGAGQGQAERRPT